jgi:hypothetical protein
MRAACDSSILATEGHSAFLLTYFCDMSIVNSSIRRNEMSNSRLLRFMGLLVLCLVASGSLSAAPGGCDGPQTTGSLSAALGGYDGPQITDSVSLGGHYGPQTTGSLAAALGGHDGPQSECAAVCAPGEKQCVGNCECSGTLSCCFSACMSCCG